MKNLDSAIARQETYSRMNKNVAAFFAQIQRPGVQGVKLQNLAYAKQHANINYSSKRS